MTDRPMSRALAAALDALTPVQRRTLKVIAGESEHDWLRALLMGLRVELFAAEQREAEVLAGLEAEHRAEAAEGAPPLPVAEGEPWFPEGEP